MYLGNFITMKMSRCILTLYYILTIKIVSKACQAQGAVPTVITPLGEIRGRYRTSFNGKTFSSFEGIPYAKPPIGERRFEEPEPIEKWEGFWLATNNYTCAQIEATSEEILLILGDEDCLYLNVYVPRVDPNPDEKLEVLVSIHGGGFSAGHQYYATPHYLMDYPELIFVTFNYRLGILGFLSTEDDVIPGNNGLKDQVMALKWVQKNIASFGGNPNSVTIHGLSAGAASVHMHYLSPMSKGLFHRGVSQSGCALNPWIANRGSLLKAQILAEAIGCPKTAREFKKCLKQRNHYQIITKLKLFYKIKAFPTIPFGPVVEKGSRPFLNEEPSKLLRRGQVYDVPWIASFVSHEGGYFIQGMNDMEQLNTIWERFAPFMLLYHSALPEEKWNITSTKIKEYYLGKNQRFNSENFDKFVKIFSDRMIKNGVIKSLQLAANNFQVSNNYFYVMNYNNGDTNMISHGDDEIYFFYYEFRKSKTATELQMKDLMTKMLVSFAKTGKPSIHGKSWESVKSDRLNFLNISGVRKEEITLQTGDNLWTSGDFWDSLEFA